MNFEKFLLILALLGLGMTSCKKEEEADVSNQMVTKYYMIGSGASSAGCYLSLADDKVYRIDTEEDVLTCDHDSLKHVDIIFDGTEFYSPSSSNNPIVKNNGIKTHVNRFDDGFFFETNEGYYGYIHFMDKAEPGDTKHNYKIRVEYKKKETPSQSIDETIGNGFVVATDTFEVVVGSKNSPVTSYFSIKLRDSVNVNESDKLQYIDFCQSQDDADQKEINLKIPDGPKYLNASLNTLESAGEGLYKYTTGAVLKKYATYEGTIKVLLTSYAGNIYEEGICIIWKLEVTRKGIRLQ